MGQIHASPLAIVERDCACRKEISRLLEVASPSTPESEVLRGIVGISEVEAPAEIEKQTFPSRAISELGIDSKTESKIHA